MIFRQKYVIKYAYACANFVWPRKKLIGSTIYSGHHYCTNQYDILKESIPVNNSELSISFVDSLKNKVLSLEGNINLKNFDAIFLETCISNKNVHLGKTFFKHLTETKQLSLAIIGKYFKLCYHFQEECDENDKKSLVLLYQDLVRKYPLLDPITCENIIMGLSITSCWKDSVKLLNTTNEFSVPTSKMYCAIIVAAFKNDCDQLGWTMLEKMAISGMKPKEIIYNTWLSKSNEDGYYEKLLNFFEKHHLYIPLETAELISKDKNCITSISKRGECINCGGTLGHIEVTQEEFEKLKHEFLNPVLIGQDIFLKSKPTELKEFKRLLENSGKVDVILDGLNVAYTLGRNSSPMVYAKTLCTVVDHFLRRNLKVMVLGRKHMKKWPKAQMNYIYKYTSFFLIDDLSQDDPLMLYAALYNGISTRFVSRDFMRGHKFLLKTENTQRTFAKWQQKNQLFIAHLEPNGTVHLKSHVPYFNNAQKSLDGSWHVPIEEPPQPGIPPNVKLANLKWLCLSHLNKC